MANPVINQQQIQAPQAPEPVVPPRAPLGVGAAPTTLEPAVERGYVETFVHWVWDWVMVIYEKLRGCFFKNETPPPAPVQPLLPEAEPLAPLPPLFVPKVGEQIGLLNAFRALSDRDQQFICFQIGMQKYRFWYRVSYERLGELEIQKDPLILRDYLAIN